MKLWNEIKNQFRKQTPLEVAAAELVEAELARLDAATGREFADSQVQYNDARITRLKKFINQTTKEEQAK